MKKHILGFAIFTLIVGLSVSLKLIFFGASTPHVSAEPSLNTSPIQNSCWRMKKETSETVLTETVKTRSPLSYEIEDLTFDAAKNVVAGKIRLNWNGAEKRPDAVTVKLKFFTLNNPSDEILVASPAFRFPFEEGDTATKSFTFVMADKNLIDPDENYYSFAELTSVKQTEVSKSGETIGLVVVQNLQNESERLESAFPVTVIHRK